MKAVMTIEDLFLNHLKDIYSAEKQLVKTLPKFASAVRSEKLREAIELHLQETEQQVKRLETILESLNASTRGPKCKAMKALIDEGNDVLDSDFQEAVRDAALIAVANKIEHYEIASYGTLVSYARQLGHGDAEQLLKLTLREEKQADEALTELAETEINVDAEPGAGSRQAEAGEAEDRDVARTTWIDDGAMDRSVTDRDETDHSAFPNLGLEGGSE